MVRRERSTLKWGLLLGLAGGVALIGASRADLIPGGGPAKSDCYIELDVKGITAANGKKIQCMDGDPCDTDGQCNDSCLFSIAVCFNQKNVPECTPQPPLTKVKAKTSNGFGITAPTDFSSSACGAFVDRTLRVKVKKNGKKKLGKATVKLLAVASGKPKKDKDKLIFQCLPREGACPTTSTTTTTTFAPCAAPTTTTLACSPPTTTTLPPPVPAGSLTFDTVAGAPSCGGPGLVPASCQPFSGALFSDTAATMPVSGGDLGLACLYIGGGAATTVPPDRIPDGSTSILTVSGTDLVASTGTGPGNCTKGVLPGFHCIGPTNTGDTCDPNNPMNPDFDCDVVVPGSCAPDAQCFFGPPLPIPNGPLTTCVLNVIKSDVGGTVDTSTGDFNLSIPMFSRVYLTGNATQPCPVCNCGTCSGGLNDGGACTPVGSLGTSLDCPPLPSQFLAPLTVTLGPLTNTAATMTAADGLFCAGQTNPGAFGKADAKAIMETGMSPGNLTDNQPHPAALASVFCIPATGNVAVDISADIPGPGAIGLNGISQLHP